MSNTSTAQIMSLVERYRTFGWLAKKPELKQQLQAAVETLVQERNELKAQIGDLPEAQKEMLKEIKSLKELLFKEQEKAVCRCSEKLVDFVSYYANCPCCDNDEECTADCTFKDDDNMSYEVMMEAREALKLLPNK